MRKLEHIDDGSLRREVPGSIFGLLLVPWTFFLADLFEALTLLVIRATFHSITSAFLH